MRRHDLGRLRWNIWRAAAKYWVLARYGIKNPDYLVPMPVDPRLGVDRDDSGNVLGPFKHALRDFSQAFG